MTGSELVGAGLSAQIFVTAEAFRLLLRVSIVPLVASFGSLDFPSAHSGSSFSVEELEEAADSLLC